MSAVYITDTYIKNHTHTFVCDLIFASIHKPTHKSVEEFAGSTDHNSVSEFVENSLYSSVWNSVDNPLVRSVQGTCAQILYDYS